jgi:hypothetical protein
MSMFRCRAREKGLKPSETRYVRGTRGGTVDLRFSKSGAPAIEKSCRTHYISPALSERKKEQLVERLNKAAKPVVFQIPRESRCTECGVELEPGSFLLMEAEQPLCLPCALDADERAGERARGAAARVKQDREMVVRMTEQITTLFPGCPPQEAAAIAAHTAVRGSGRIGRTAAGRNLDEQTPTAAVAAAVRHRHTEYESLLASGLDRALARERVTDQVQAILAAWGNRD